MENGSSLVGRFLKINLLLSKNDYKKTLEAVGDPCRGQSRVLLLLRKHPVVSQKELSELLGIRTQSLGELLIKLEKNGYISREPSDEDRRIKTIALTGQGAMAAERLEQAKQERFRFLSCLSREEQSRLIEMMDRLIGSLEDEVGGAEEPERPGGRPAYGRCPYPHQVSAGLRESGGADD